MSEKLKKGQRLRLFYAELAKEAPPGSLNESRNLMAQVMNRIESSYALDDPEPMTIPELPDWRNAEYGKGGAYIPLINGAIHINANGAAGFYDSYKKHYAFTLRSASGADFVPKIDYIYSLEAAQARCKTSMAATSAKVKENVEKPIPTDPSEMSLKKISWLDRIARFLKLK
ncbi:MULTISPECIES: hypothetical protein [Pseudomonas syringae group genomosp. 2]|uniref:Uncharacterized protein n=3 Tax=Pseudomonas syringae group genomosp. 2 TaxID=251698 RepID=A0AAX1VQL8_PSEAJ|nr:hypothetical protein [Pseudomonas amygdali]KPX59570.1 hypothetical protein ALO35_200026 [Pseudomonas amygdali pv. lachrymans]KPY82865.1 hypothetical protein ALO60_200139 [Pseudomonas amygdali pv. tabaci]RML78238.1 hypothetical protein ALQ89_02357 [Pseudomonas amygdali pv. tabaci]RMR89465.1 hypothetical protein ALP77_200071 [Pseudomonas amygdali pv. tabaci]